MRTATVVCLLALTVVASTAATTPRPTPALPEEGDAEATAVFNAWFRNLTVANRAVHIERSQWGKGVFVNTTVGKYDTLMKVPKRAALCDESIRARPYGGLLFPAHDSRVQLQADDRIALALAAEYLLGPASPLRPWIRALPRLRSPDLYPPWAWPEAEVRRIEPASVRQAIRRRQGELADQWRAVSQRTRIVPNLRSTLMSFLGAHFTEHGPGNVSDGGALAFSTATVSGKTTTVTKDLYLWGKALVDTRAWNIEGKKYLVPAADFFNHHADAEDVAFNPREVTPQRSMKFLTFHKIYGAEFHVLSDRPLAPPKDSHRPEDAPVPLLQLSESYGDNSDAIYFEYHGFSVGAPELYAAAYMDKPLPAAVMAAWPEAQAQRFDSAAKAGAAWRALRTDRNRWDYHDLPLQSMAWWRPVAADVGAGAVPTKRPPAVANDSPAVVADNKAREAFLRRFRVPQSVHAYFGELHPALVMHHLVTVLPKAALEGPCRRIEPPPQHRNGRHRPPFAVWAEALASLRRCAQQSDEVTANGGETAFLLAAYRSLRVSVVRVFAYEFATSSVDADVLALAPAQLAELSEPYRTAARARGRFAVQRKLLFKELLRQVKRKLTALAAELEKQRADDGSDANDDL